MARRSGYCTFCGEQKVEVGSAIRMLRELERARDERRGRSTVSFGSWVMKDNRWQKVGGSFNEHSAGRES